MDKESQVRIQDLVGEGGPVSESKVADIAERSHVREASYLQLGFRAHLRALEAFGFLTLMVLQSI